jgi:lysophospholipase L1-like esterase
VVILGASYAANWKVAELGGVPVVNAGVPGQISSEMLDRFDRDVVAARPRAVVMWGFINDIFRADDMERSRARVRESYLEMIKRARAEGIEPILATEVTIRPAKAFVETVMSTIGWLLGKLSYQDQVNRHVMELNQWLREYARNEAILVLDLQGALADADGQRRREYATDDGSHISAEGYDALTTYARPILTRHLGAAAREPAKP